MNLCEKRKQYKPQVPLALENLSLASVQHMHNTSCIADEEEVKQHFPNIYGSPIVQVKSANQNEHKRLKIGVVLSGGQAPGGHNVIAGIFDAIEQLNVGSDLIGFLGGPIGIIEGEYKNLEKNEIDAYRNQGGFDIIGSGRTKIETKEQLDRAMRVVKKLQLDGLVVIGGDDSNTNAAVLAQYFIEHDLHTKVIGVPKTIDGDLKNDYVEVSFGFDTATKTYSEMIGNIAKDALSAKKYYHFIKLMGRSASHIALECALNTHPNLTFISEEVKEKGFTLSDIIHQIADMVEKRHQKEKSYGIVLIPEGLIEFIPEMEALIKELNQHLSNGESFDLNKLSNESATLYQSLPQEIQHQLIMDRDPHGNVQVSHIQTEKLLLALTQEELQRRNFSGSFNPVQHFFGYEGRSALPSNFDATYCYNLGRAAVSLIVNELTGYMVAIKNLSEEVSKWEIYGLPITSLLNVEVRKGKRKPVIQKALVNLGDKPFQHFSQLRKSWLHEEDYQFPGPIQFFGDHELTDSAPFSLVVC